jgi:F0F1-type ATP synthase alpha subunit
MAESTLSVKDLSEELQQAISRLHSNEGLEEVGVVTRVGDGIACFFGWRWGGYNDV